MTESKANDRATGGEPVVEITGLHKRYGDVAALDGLELTVQSGEIFGLLGPNGAGKTTTVRVLTTLERSDEGTARVLGLDVGRAAAEVRARIGYVPQEVSADRYLTARESLELFCRLHHMPAPARRRRIDELLALVGLEEAADRPARTYSGGMKKKLDLVCGLVHDPKALFLDEPSLGLDVEVRRALWDHVQALRDAGTTVILCTNYMDEADRLCDRLAIIDRGRVVAVGTPDELRAGLGGDVVTVELIAESALADAEAALAGLGAAQRTWRDGRRLHIGVDSNETALPEIIGRLRSAGLALSAAGYRRPDLEEVFIQRAGRRFADAKGTSGPPPRRRR